MKTIASIAFVALALTTSAAFAAGGGGGQGKSPAQFCKNELATLGAANFKSLYAPTGSGANAFGKCVSKHARAAATNTTNAAKACKAEQAMPEADFRAAHDGKSFAEFYGKNKNDQERLRQVRLVEGEDGRRAAGGEAAEGREGVQGGACR